jgi:hypothetical protein
LGLYILKTEIPYLIQKIERIGRRVIFYFDCPLGYQYCLPEHYANVVSEDNIDAVNNGRVLHTMIKRRRKDTDVYDLVIE